LLNIICRQEVIPISFKKVLYAPQGRALSVVISTFGSGVLCSSVVTDITVNGKLEWSRITSSVIAWVTLIFSLFLLFYYVGMYKVDTENDAVLKNYQDKDILIAMMRKGQINALIKRSKDQIKKGNYAELITIDQFLTGVSNNDAGSNDESRQGKDSKIGV